MYLEMKTTNVVSCVRFVDENHIFSFRLVLVILIIAFEILSKVISLLLHCTQYMIS